MKPLQGLIFDLEGTLLDGAVDLRQAINLTLADHGRRALTIQEVNKMLGEGSLMLVERAFEATGKPIEDDIFPFVQQFIAHHRQVKPDPSQIYSGVTDFLTKYSQSGIKLGICTNMSENSSRRLLDQLGLGDYFAFIGGGDTFPVHKPNAGHVNGVVKGLDAAHSGCVFIGDSQNDLHAAHDASVAFVLVTHGRELKSDLVKHAGSVIAEFDELPAALQKLGFSF